MSLDAHQKDKLQKLLSGFDNHDLLEYFDMFRPLAAKPPENGLVTFGERQLSVNIEMFRSGKYFEICQLIRDEIKTRGLKIPGAER